MTIYVKFLDRNTYVQPSLVSFRFIKVSLFQVKKCIDHLSCEKAPGLDTIRVKDIKCVCKQIKLCYY